MVKGTRSPEESEENTMSKFKNSVIRNGGYIVHKPSQAGGIGTLFAGWDANDGKYIFRHDNGMIFLDYDFAQEVAHVLGNEWKVKQCNKLTNNDFETMEALAAIFD